ncbi:MAG TPA: bifunctional oligoribonuclease/PAP phosphatase NrnA [Streptosporangiaceae bacterium]|nr:bifunctional oligoribonuclease/PAP phosphatase NrnA [Streptosporangiaceae bacterium]
MSVVSSSATAPDLPPNRAQHPPDGNLAAEWARAVAALDTADEVCLACHVRPDGDALGSMLALAHALGARREPPACRNGNGQGQRIVASFGDDPLRVPDNLRFLPGLDLLTPPGEYPAEPQVMITFDAASLSRLGVLAPYAARASELIVVDHHASNTRFGTVHLVDPAAAATAVLACELVDRLGVPLNRPVAMGLYAGLVTDTGSFKHASTTAGVHGLAARLLETGIEPEVVARELWDRAPFGYLRVLGAALGRAVLEPQQAGGRGLVWTMVSRADRAAHGVGYDTVEPMIDVVRRTEEAEVAIVFKQDDDDAWQVSARSKGNVDIGRVCVKLGGGGHPVAAGFTSRWPVQDAIQRLRELLGGEPEGCSAVPARPADGAAQESGR